MSITAQIATLQDIPVLVDLMQEFYAEASYTLDRTWAAESFTHFLSDPSFGSAWLLSYYEQPAGYVVLTVRFAMEFGGLDGFIDDLFVRPAYRRLGIAHLALTILMAECRRRGLLALHVEVGRENDPANALYARFGLRPYTDGRQLLTTTLDAGSDADRS